jgi:predicted DNA-binding WGR domain protein
MITRLEYDDGERHRKFWQVELLDIGVGAVVNTEWGRLYDRAPASQVKTFATVEEAEKHVAAKIKEKRRKGYSELWGAETVSNHKDPVQRIEVTEIPVASETSSNAYIALLGKTS